RRAQRAESGGYDRVGGRRALRVSGHDPEERVTVEGEELCRLGRGHRRRSRHVAQQGDLAEIVPGTELAEGSPVRGDVERPFEHEVEVVALLTFAHQLASRFRRNRYEL